MGRKKIKIQRIAEERNRSVTYLKRKAGLMKKAHELAVLTDSDVAVIVFAKNGKLAEFCSTDIDQLLLRYTEHEGQVERRGPDFYFKQAAKDAGSDQDEEDEDEKPSLDPSPGPSGPGWGDGGAGGSGGPSAGGSASGSAGPSGPSSAAGAGGRSSSGAAEGKKRSYGGASGSGQPSSGKRRAMDAADDADAAAAGDASISAGLVAAEPFWPPSSSSSAGGARMGRSVSASGPVPLYERRELRAALVQRQRASDAGPSTQGCLYAQQPQQPGHQEHDEQRQKQPQSQQGTFYASSSSGFAVPDTRLSTAHAVPDSRPSTAHAALYSSSSADFAVPDSRPSTAHAMHSHAGLHDEALFAPHARHHSLGHASQQQHHAPPQGQFNHPASVPLDAPFTPRAGPHMAGASWEQARYSEQQEQLPHQTVLRQHPQYSAYARSLMQQEQERQTQQQQPHRQLRLSALAPQHAGGIQMQQEQMSASRTRALSQLEASRSAAAYRALQNPIEPYPTLAASGSASMLAHGSAPPPYDASAGVEVSVATGEEKWPSQQQARQSARSFSYTSSSSAAGGSDLGVPSSYPAGGGSDAVAAAASTGGQTPPSMSTADFDVLIGSVLSHTPTSAPSSAAAARAAQITSLPASGMNKTLTPPMDVDAPLSTTFGHAGM